MVFHLIFNGTKNVYEIEILIVAAVALMRTANTSTKVGAMCMCERMRYGEEITYMKCGVLLLLKCIVVICSCAVSVWIRHNRIISRINDHIPAWQSIAKHLMRVSCF